jgi:hypothetical protein
MTQRAIQIDLIVIPSSVAHLCKHAGTLKLPNDSLGCALGDTNVCRYVP